jgi:hypothetical protein
LKRVKENRKKKKREREKEERETEKRGQEMAFFECVCLDLLFFFFIRGGVFLLFYFSARGKGHSGTLNLD